MARTEAAVRVVVVKVEAGVGMAMVVVLAAKTVETALMVAAMVD